MPLHLHILPQELIFINLLIWAKTWRKVQNIPNAIRTAIEVTPADPNMVFALSSERNTMQFLSLIASEYAGENWTTLYQKVMGLIFLVGTAMAKI
jgi:hypothetical protein